MPSLFNVLICILACAAGFLIGKIYRTSHKAKKNPNYTKDGKIDMSHYKNLTALHEKMEKRSEQKAQQSRTRQAHSGNRKQRHS